jgi:hypothetical protein
MPIVIIEKKDINRHPDLKEELMGIAKSVDEWDGTIIYRTAPEKVSAFIRKLNMHHIGFHLKHSEH